MILARAMRLAVVFRSGHLMFLAFWRQARTQAVRAALRKAGRAKVLCSLDRCCAGVSRGTIQHARRRELNRPYRMGEHVH